MDRKERLFNLLKKAEVFSGLSKRALNLIIEKMKPVTFKPGQVICREGEEGHVMYIIDRGEVRVLKEGKNKKVVEITTLGVGEVAGIMSLFEKDVRSATLQAKKSVGAWELDKETFRELIENNAGLCHSLFKTLSGYLRRETGIIAEMRSYDTENRLKVAIYDTKPYTEKIFNERNNGKYALTFYNFRLNKDTVKLAAGFKVICVFVNDDVSKEVVAELDKLGVELIALRCAGYNNVDLETCKKCGMSAARVPAYSPYAVAEHAVALMMALNRHTQRAHSRIREGNFSLNGLEGFDMHGKTAGVIGTGKIGKCVINILLGFGCKVIAYDKFPDRNLEKEKGIRYVKLNELFSQSDIITMHAPLTPESYHMINKKAINMMKDGVMIINTSRGGLVDTKALINGMKTGKIGHAGLDVYEEEGTYFFEDFSESIIQDEVLARLTTFNNVMITSHMAFLTREALSNIADTTFANIAEYASGKRGTQMVNNVIPK